MTFIVAVPSLHSVGLCSLYTDGSTQENHFKYFWIFFMSVGKQPCHQNINFFTILPRVSEDWDDENVNTRTANRTQKTSYSWRSPTFSGQRSQLIWSGDTHLHSQWANGVSSRRDDECVVTKWCMLTDRRVEFPSPFSRLMDSLTSPCTYAKIIQGFRLLRFLQSLTGMMNVSKWNNQHGAQSLSWGPNKWLSLRKKEGKWRWLLARIHRNSARPWSWGGLTFYQY